MGIDIARLGPAAQEQIRAELERRQRQQQALDMRRRAQRAANLGSDLERRYYEAYIWPDLLAGKVASCETQCRFDLLPPAEYCGIRLPAAHYMADFVVKYTSGTVKVVEVKSAFVRKAQRDYIYRRRLFIDLIARPKGWIFEEYIERSQ